MNYSKKAEEIRQAMKPVRIQAGKWLLLHLSRSWSAGEAALIPPGTYWMTQPIMLPPGAEVYSMGCELLLEAGPSESMFQIPFDN